MVYLGIDWARDHHDLCLSNEAVNVSQLRAFPDVVEGLAATAMELVAPHADSVDWLSSASRRLIAACLVRLVASGYAVYASTHTQ